MKQNKANQHKPLAVKEVLYNFSNLWVKEVTSKMYLLIGEVWEDIFLNIFFLSCFVIRHSTKNVHGKYKQTSQ